MSARRQKGSIIVYILIAIFLIGLLVKMMTEGVTKSASSSQINGMVMELHSDIQTIQSKVDACAVVYQKDISTAPSNPNPPFPLYCSTTTCSAWATTSSGDTGTTLPYVGCPGAPATTSGGQVSVFPDAADDHLQLLGDTSQYNVTYITDSTNGIMLRITRVGSDPLWSEAMSRLQSKFSTCQTAIETSNPDPLGANCTGGCFYYFILRNTKASTAFPCP